MKSLKKSVMYGCLFTLSMMPTRVHPLKWDDMAAITLIGGTIAAVAGIAAYALTPESNESLFNRLEIDYQSTTHLVKYINPYTHKNLFYTSFCERDLYDFLYITLHNRSFETFEKEVTHELYTLISIEKQLKERLLKDTSKQHMLHHQMNSLLEKTRVWQQTIGNTLMQLINQHGDYFKLAQYMHELEKSYDNSYNAINLYGYNSFDCDMNIKNIIIHNTSSSAYPFLSQYEYATQHIQKLHRLRSSVSSSVYPTLMHRVDRMQKAVNYIQMLIATSPEYAHDVWQKKQDDIRRAQEQLARERELFEQEKKRAAQKAKREAEARFLQDIKEKQKKASKKIKKGRKKLEKKAQIV